MARPKQFAEMTMARFLDETFARIDTVLSSDEDRTSFIRYSVKAEIARRSRDFYSDLKGHLLVGESELDFCLNAIRHAVQDRKAAVASKGVERATPANPTQGPQPAKRIDRSSIRQKR